MSTAPLDASPSAPSANATASPPPGIPQRAGVLMRYLMAVRVQILAAGLMVAVLALPLTPLWSVVGNMFVVGTFELGLVAFASLFAGWFIVHLTRVAWAGAPDRLQPQRYRARGDEAYRSHRMRLWFDMYEDGERVDWTTGWMRHRKQWPRQLLRQWLPALVLAAFPVGLAIVRTWRERGPETPLLTAIAVPVAAGIALFMGAVVVLDIVFPPLRRVVLDRFRGVAIGFLGHLGPGYLRDGKVRPEQRFALSMFVLLTVVYLGTMWITQPGDHRVEGCAAAARCFPVIGYAALVLVVLTSLLAGLTFLLDYWRVPTLGLLFVAAVLADRTVHSDYAYRVVDRDGSAAAVQPVGPRDVLNAVAARWQGHAVTPTLITVAASGGGITSAAWTTRVLTSLEHCYGDAFARSLGVVSGASGGSVGTMFYLAPRFASPGKARDDAALLAVRRAATSGGLRAVAWGIAFPDLLKVFKLRGVSGWVVGQRYDLLDRAWSLERVWMAAWNHYLTDAGLADPPPTLGAWRARVRGEGLPVSIFGAMTVEDGRLILLTPGSMSNARDCRGFDGKRDAITTFDCLYAAHDRDLDVVTAARLSASFPWVSPNARALPETGELDPDAEPAYHVIDGGIFDNSGASAAALWLNEALAQGGAPIRVKVLPILIRWSTWSPKDPADVKGPRGLLTALGQPFKAMVSGRSSTQSVANARADRLYREALLARQPGIEIEPEVVFNLGLPSQPPTAGSRSSPGPGGSPAKEQELVPLSWQLSARQLKAIRDYSMNDEGVKAAMRAVGRALNISDLTDAKVNACLAWGD